MSLKRKDHLFRVCDAFRLEYPEDRELSADDLQAICFYYGITTWDKDRRERAEAIIDHLDMVEGEDFKKKETYIKFLSPGLVKIYKSKGEKSYEVY